MNFRSCRSSSDNPDLLALVHDFNDSQDYLKQLERQYKRLSQQKMHSDLEENIGQKMKRLKMEIDFREKEKAELQAKIQKTEAVNKAKKLQDRLIQNALSREYLDEIRMKREKEKEEVRNK